MISSREIEAVLRLKEEVARAMPSVEEMERVKAQLPSPNLVSRMTEELHRSRLPYADGVSSAARAIQEVTGGSAFLGFGQSLAKLAEGLSFNKEFRSAFSGGEAMKLAESIGGIAKMKSFSSELQAALDGVEIRSISEELRKGFAGIGEFMSSPLFQSSVEQARASASFAERILAHAIVIDADVDMGVDEPLATVQSVVDERVAVLPRGTISRGGMLQIWLAVILFLVQLHLNSQSERRLMEHSDQQLAALTRTILERIETQLAPRPDAAEQLAIVVRRSNVRVAPDKEAERLDSLKPGQNVRVTRWSEDWLEVEYFYFENAEVRKGWVIARNTKSINK